mgnify:CR=1 FL=1
MRNYKPYTSYKLLPKEQQLPVLYKPTRQEGILFAYAIEDDTYAIKLANGSIAFTVKKEQFVYI